MDYGIECIYNTVRRLLAGRSDTQERKTTSRFSSARVDNRVAKLPAIDSDAMRELRTLYPHTIVSDLPPGYQLLKSGMHASKIGARVLKGKWQGMPIFTLTLEERATCPVSCRHLRSCFGNKMQFATRHAHGTEFELRLVENVVALARKHPHGFVVRLHMLGDFYSVRYVNIWRAMIDTLPPLRVFGYTARWDDEIGHALQGLVAERWERFAVRFSNAPVGCLPTTISLELPVQLPADAVLCPEQMGQSESCATCAFCWQSERRVAFLQH